MTDVSNAALLQAYKDAIEANEDGIAELLKTVILELMRGERSIVIGESRTTTEPPWKVTCGPDIVPLDSEKLDMVTIGATDDTRPSWQTNGPITVNTADAVRDWDDDE